MLAVRPTLLAGPSCVMVVLAVAIALPHQLLQRRGCLTPRLVQLPLGDDVERFLARQFVESMMISKFVDEVFTDDNVMYKKVIGVLTTHNVDEREIRDEAMDKVKNIREGTIEYEIALQNAVKEVKKRRGLIR